MARIFHCHNCGDNCDVNLEEWKCTKCNTGFIEEINRPPIAPAPTTQSISGTVTISTSSSNRRPELYITNDGAISTQRPNNVQQIIQTLFAGMNIAPNFNHRDYAWGEQGLDAIISQLMEQVEGAAPPARSEVVEQLEIKKFDEKFSKESTQK